MLKSKEKHVENLISLIMRFNKRMSRINHFLVLKKMDNLGLNEFNFKNKLIDIQRNDILLVHDPNIISQRVIKLLENNVFIIVHKKPITKNIQSELPFVFVSADKLSIDEDKYFGFVDKNQFEIEKNKLDWVNKVIHDYQREKEQLISR